jgi:hypothetical protein
MRTSHAIVLSLALIVSTAIASAGYVLANRYELASMSGNNVIWKVDQVTGQTYGCEESEFGPFCILAPNQIKHSEGGGGGIPGPGGPP